MPKNKRLITLASLSSLTCMVIPIAFTLLIRPLIYSMMIILVVHLKKIQIKVQQLTFLILIHIRCLLVLNSILRFSNNLIVITGARLWFQIFQEISNIYKDDLHWFLSRFICFLLLAIKLVCCILLQVTLLSNLFSIWLLLGIVLSRINRLLGFWVMILHLLDLWQLFLLQLCTIHLMVLLRNYNLNMLIPFSVILRMKCYNFVLSLDRNKLGIVTAVINLCLIL